MAYEYPKAGHGAPPEVKAAIARFHKQPEKDKEYLPLLWALLGPDASTRDYKMGKRDAKYTTHPVGGESCAKCRYAYYSVYEKVYVCSQVAGVIRPQDSCKLFED